jgi:hypothetical protein
MLENWKFLKYKCHLKGSKIFFLIILKNNLINNTTWVIS